MSMTGEMYSHLTYHWTRAHLTRAGLLCCKTLLFTWGVPRIHRKGDQVESCPLPKGYHDQHHSPHKSNLAGPVQAVGPGVNDDRTTRISTLQSRSSTCRPVHP